MTENLKVENPNEITPEPKEQDVKPVPVSTDPEPSPILEKVLKEKKNAMERVRQLEAQMKEINDARLKEKEDFKTLWEQEKEQHQTLRQELESERMEKINGFKTAAIKKELSKMGAHANSIDALLRLADMEQLKYDTEHKMVLGAENIAKSIKDSLPQAFGVSSAGVDQDAPSTSTPSNIDISSFKNLSAKEKRNPDIIRQVFANAGITLKD